MSQPDVAVASDIHPADRLLSRLERGRPWRCDGSSVVVWWWLTWVLSIAAFLIGVATRSPFAAFLALCILLAVGAVAPAFAAWLLLPRIAKLCQQGWHEQLSAIPNAATLAIDRHLSAALLRVRPVSAALMTVCWWAAMGAMFGWTFPGMGEGGIIHVELWLLLYGVLSPLTQGLLVYPLRLHGLRMELLLRDLAEQRWAVEEDDSPRIAPRLIGSGVVSILLGLATSASGVALFWWSTVVELELMVSIVLQISGTLIAFGAPSAAQKFLLNRARDSRRRAHLDVQLHGLEAGYLTTDP